MKIGVVGLGFVGGALFDGFAKYRHQMLGYDKYKNEGCESLEALISSEIIFLCF